MPDPMESRIRMMVSRGTLSGADDAPGVQALQIELLDDEVAEDVERIGEYGFTSKPHAGAEVAMVFVGGLRSHGLVIGIEDRRYRLKDMEDGEVAIYDDLGQCVHLKRDGIEITTEQRVTVNADSVEVNAESVVVNSDDINLGGSGGAAVARVGDPVAGGVITAGSSKVSAA